MCSLLFVANFYLSTYFFLVNGTTSQRVINFTKWTVRSVVFIAVMGTQVKEILTGECANITTELK